MGRVKKSDVIQKAWARTTRIVFVSKPVKKWVKLTLIAYIAGASSFFSLNGGPNFGNPSPKELKQTAAPADASAFAGRSNPAGSPDSGSKTRSKEPGLIRSGSERPGPSLSERIASVPPKFWVWGAAAAFLGFLLVLLMIWYSSRFKFVWFSSVARNESNFSEPYQRHREQGISYFKASLALSAVFLGVMLAVGVLWVWSIARAGLFDGGLSGGLAVFMQAVLPAVLLLIVFILIGASLNALAEGFVIPIMAFDRSTFMPAVQKFLSIFRSRKTEAFLFCLVTFGLWIAASFLLLAVGIVVLIASVLAGLVVFGGGFLIFMTLLKAKAVFIVYCVIAGAPFIVATILIWACSSLPAVVFFRAWSLEYLLALNCGYSEETLAAYAADHADVRSKRAFWIPFLLLSTLAAVALIGLLAAIAIPNFIAARDAARSAPSGSPAPGAGASAGLTDVQGNDAEENRDIDSYSRELGIKK